MSNIKERQAFIASYYRRKSEGSAQNLQNSRSVVQDRIVRREKFHRTSHNAAGSGGRSSSGGGTNGVGSGGFGGGGGGGFATNGIHHHHDDAGSKIRNRPLASPASSVTEAMCDKRCHADMLHNNNSGILDGNSEASDRKYIVKRQYSSSHPTSQSNDVHHTWNSGLLEKQLKALRDSSSSTPIVDNLATIVQTRTRNRPTLGRLSYDIPSQTEYRLGKVDVLAGNNNKRFSSSTFNNGRHASTFTYKVKGQNASTSSENSDQSYPATFSTNKQHHSLTNTLRKLFRPHQNRSRPYLMDVLDDKLHTNESPTLLRSLTMKSDDQRQKDFPFSLVDRRSHMMQSKSMESNDQKVTLHDENPHFLKSNRNSKLLKRCFSSSSRNSKNVSASGSKNEDIQVNSLSNGSRTDGLLNKSTISPLKSKPSLRPSDNLMPLKAHPNAIPPRLENQNML